MLYSTKILAELFKMILFILYFMSNSYLKSKVNHGFFANDIPSPLVEPAKLYK